MNWEKSLLYLLIGFVIAVIFVLINRKIKVVEQEEQYIWGSSIIFFWPLYIFFCIYGALVFMAGGIIHLFAVLIKLITGGYKRNVSSRR